MIWAVFWYLPTTSGGADTAKKILELIVVLCSAGLCLADCPSADLTGDCFVDYQDFALMANQWLTGDPCIPDDMAYIPAGTFEMGDSFSEGESDERPVHTVMLDSFYMGKYEITNAQYCDYLNSALDSTIYVSVFGVVCGSENNQEYCDTRTSSSSSQIARSDGVFSVRTKMDRDMSNDPMVNVSWCGAAAYCNWRSQQEGRQQCYNLIPWTSGAWTCDFGKHGYRLATEAEWEYAARGALPATRFPWGDTISHAQANYESNSSFLYDVSPTRGFHPSWYDGVPPYTSPAGSFSPNGHGLYDMAGNVFEWCNDWHFSTYYASSPTNNPTGPESGWYRIIRGGNWSHNANYCRVTNRTYVDPTVRMNDLGFRLVLDLE